MKVLIADKFNDALPRELAAAGHQVATDLAELADADVLVVRSKTKATAEFLAPAARLKLVIRGGVGIDNIDAEHCRSRGIAVRNTPEASAPAVAEMAIGLMLAFARRIPQAHASTAAGRWEKSAFKGTELAGKTLGMVGLGRIGQRVARVAQGLGMRVLAYDPVVTPERAAELGVEAAALEEVLARADFLSLHAPGGPETRGLIGAAALAGMKPTAVLINTARGSCVDEAALAAALKAGKLGGAALDVFEREPPAGSPLLGAPNVILTPHLGASTAENLARIAARIVELVAELAGGRSQISGSRR